MNPRQGQQEEYGPKLNRHYNQQSTSISGKYEIQYFSFLHSLPLEVRNADAEQSHDQEVCVVDCQRRQALGKVVDPTSSGIGRRRCPAAAAATSPAAAAQDPLDGRLDEDPEGHQGTDDPEDGEGAEDGSVQDVEEATVGVHCVSLPAFYSTFAGLIF